MALIDFTLSNARRFHSSMGNPLGLKGLRDLCKIGLPNKLNLPITEVQNLPRAQKF